MVAALGFRVHTGWAAMVAVDAGPRERVLGQLRVDLVPAGAERFVFHAAADLDPASATALVDGAAATARKLAGDAIAALVESIGDGARVVAAGIAAPGAALPPLADILRSHPRIHAAEGELFRRALVDAAASRGLAVVVAASRDVRGGVRGKVAPTPATSDLRARIVELGRGTKPWAADQKEATMLALIALAKATRDGKVDGGTL